VILAGLMVRFVFVLFADLRSICRGMLRGPDFIPRMTRRASFRKGDDAALSCVD